MTTTLWCLAAFIYFLPTVAAVHWHCHWVWTLFVFVLNLTLGWTGLGWLGACLLASTQQNSGGFHFRRHSRRDLLEPQTRP